MRKRRQHPRRKRRQHPRRKRIDRNEDDLFLSAIIKYSVHTYLIVKQNLGFIHSVRACFAVIPHYHSKKRGNKCLLVEFEYIIKIEDQVFFGAQQNEKTLITIKFSFLEVEVFTRLIYIFTERTVYDRNWLLVRYLTG